MPIPTTPASEWKTDIEFLALKKQSQDEGWDGERFTHAIKELAEQRRQLGVRVSPPRPTMVPTAKRVTDHEFLVVRMRSKAEGWTDDRFTREVMALRERREKREGSGQ